MVTNDLLQKIDKNQLIIRQNRPLAQEQVKNLKEYFKIGMTYASNAIEGNMLTETETKVILEEGITVAGKPLRDHLEAVGHAHAFDYLWELAKKLLITEDDIQHLHQLCFSPSVGDRAGNYRNVDVIITGSQHNDKLSRHYQVAEDMRKLVSALPDKQKTLHSVVYAAVLHRDFIYIHPFEDGNGRAARLLMNHALLSRGYPPVVISPYFKQDYILAIENSHANSQPFIRYICEQALQAQRDYMRLLHLQPDRAGRMSR